MHRRWRKPPQYVFVLQREILLGAQFKIPWMYVLFATTHISCLEHTPTNPKTFEEVLAVDNIEITYREVNKGLYMVARNFFLLLLNFSAWPCLGPA